MFSSLFIRIGFFEFLDIELFHREHSLHNSSGSILGEELPKDIRNYLPRNTELIAYPTTLFSDWNCRECIPIVIYFFLGFTGNNPGYCRGVLVYWSTIESSEYIPIERKHNHHHRTWSSMIVSFSIIGDIFDF